MSPQCSSGGTTPRTPRAAPSMRAGLAVGLALAEGPAVGLGRSSARNRGGGSSVGASLGPPGGCAIPGETGFRRSAAVILKIIRGAGKIAGGGAGHPGRTGPEDRPGGWARPPGWRADGRIGGARGELRRGGFCSGGGGAGPARGRAPGDEPGSGADVKGFPGPEARYRRPGAEAIGKVSYLRGASGGCVARRDCWSLFVIETSKTGKLISRCLLLMTRMPHCMQCVTVIRSCGTRLWRCRASPGPWPRRWRATGPAGLTSRTR